jgi:hypothetical protein
MLPVLDHQPRRKHAMAKGQMRSNKEKKKPKAAHNDKKKGGAPAFGAGPGQNAPSANPFAKKN